MKKIVLALSACFIAITMMSQISFGPRIGLNMSKYALNWNDDWDEPELKYKAGFSIAGVMNWQINDFLAFQPALSFTKKGTSYDVDSWNSGNTVNTGFARVRVAYFEVPLNFAAGIRLGTGQVQLFAGPYISIAIMGANVWDYEENDNGIRTDFAGDEKIYFDSKASHEVTDWKIKDQRPLDFGVNFGLGYSYNQLLFNVGLAMGLSNLQPDRGEAGFDLSEC